MQTLSNITSQAVVPAALTRPSAGQLFESAPQRIDIAHTELAYWRAGSGPDLVLVHGWPLHAATFRYLLPTLTRHFTCHLFDLPGTGQSSSSAAAPIDMQSHARSLKDAIDTLQLRRYALLGHDSGGLVARLLCAMDPRATCLVLSGTEIGGHRSWLVQMLVWAARLPLGALLLRWALSRRIVQRSPLGFAGCFARLEHLDGDFRDRFIVPFVASTQAARRQLAQLRSWNWAVVDGLPATHAKIAVPTQLIWGSHDGLFPVARARRMAAEFKGSAAFAEIPRGRAFLHEDMPDEYLAVALPFLAQHAAGQS